MSDSRLESLRARIDLPVLKRAIGVLEGRHQSIRAGRGQDFDDLVEYQPGDEVSDIDWKSSARVGHPIIRRFEKLANSSVILVVDTGRTMGALAPSGETKEQVAVGICELIAYLSRIRGDRVGLVAGDSERLRELPARFGNSHLETLLRFIERDIDVTAPVSNLHRVLQRAFISTRQRSLLVVVTDEMHLELAEEELLRKIRTRHQVLVLAVADLIATNVERETLPVDVESGPLPDFIRGDEALLRQASEVVTRRKSMVREMLQRRGIPAAVVGGTEDIGDALVDVLTRSKYAKG